MAKIVRDKLAPKAIILDQYNNDNNWLAHYKHTGREILEVIDGKCDGIFVGTGTGGTITGVSKKVKEAIPSCKIIGVDPYGSIMADPENPDEQLSMPSYKVEGIGYDFIPKNCERDVIDEWVKIDDHQSFKFARQMLKTEGLLCGGTSGSTVAACCKWIKENNLQDREDLRFICFASDSIRNYLSKHLSDEWMVQYGFTEKEIFYDESHPLCGKTADMCNLRHVPHYDARLTVSDALDCFRNGDKLVPLIESGKVFGVLTENSLLEAIVTKKLGVLASAQTAITKEFCMLPFDTDLSIVYRMLTKNPAI